VTSATGSSQGSQITATATCDAGSVLLGGGAEVTTNDAARRERVTLTASYPSSTTTWTAVGTAISTLQAAQTMTVQAFALCSL
jgi:hypothetical protein